MADNQNNLSIPTDSIQPYRRDSVPVPRRWLRLKERDSYVFGDDRWQITMAAADYGYVGWLTVTVADLWEEREHTAMKRLFLPCGRMELPSSVDTGDFLFRSKDVSVDFIKSPGKRIIRCRWTAFDDVRPLYINATLENPPYPGISATVPFPKSPGRFNLSHKTVGAAVSGTMVYGADNITFAPDKSVGAYRFDRGLLPYEARRQWCWAADSAADSQLAFCLGGWGGRGETKTPGGVSFAVIAGNYYQMPPLTVRHDHGFGNPWELRSPDRHVDLRFVPYFQRHDYRSILGLAEYDIHQVFGKYYGELRVEDSISATLDGIPGFAEDLLEKL